MLHSLCRHAEDSGEASVLDAGHRDTPVLRTVQWSASVLAAGRRDTPILRTGQWSASVLAAGRRDTPVLRTGQWSVPSKGGCLVSSVLFEVYKQLG